MKYYIVYCTVPDQETADKVSDTVLTQKLTACANCVPGIISRYWWHGEICTGTELLLIMKTNGENLTALMEEIKNVHPYEVPEVIAAEIAAGNPDYLAWIDKSTESK